MSLHYLLDGYNILKQIASFNDLPLEQGRKGFLRWIEAARPQGSANNRITVVFDGHPDYVGVDPAAYLHQEGLVYVIYSEGCSADTQIKRMVEEGAPKASWVVVSDDKEVFLYARSLGAQVMSVRAFIARSTPLRQSGGDKSKHISLSHQEKINQELWRLWVKDK